MAPGHETQTEGRQGLCIMKDSQIFTWPVQPNSVNNYFNTLSHQQIYRSILELFALDQSLVVWVCILGQNCPQTLKEIVRHTYLVRFPVEGGATVMLSFVLRVLADLVFLSTVLGDISFLYWGMMHQTVILLLDVIKIKYSYCTCVYSNSLFI